MMAIHIICADQTEAKKIIHLLIGERLIWNATVMESTGYTRKRGPGKINETQQVLITAKTKSLLFQPINHRLRETYGDQMPVLYALPIVYMDPEQADQLLQRTLKT
ncbi:divalent cation tolerance protein CutA [Flavobacteriaceae bacterium 3-367]